MTDEQRLQFTADVLEWFEGMEADSHDWAEGLLMAALDETRGNGPLALKLAKQEYEKDPHDNIGQKEDAFATNAQRIQEEYNLSPQEMEEVRAKFLSQD